MGTQSKIRQSRKQAATPFQPGLTTLNQPLQLGDQDSQVVDEQMAKDAAYFAMAPNSYAFYRPITAADRVGNGAEDLSAAHSMLVIRHVKMDGVRARIPSHVRTLAPIDSGWNEQQALGFWQRYKYQMAFGLNH